MGNKSHLKKDLINFLNQEFHTGNLKPVHMGQSTTEYKSSDWLEPIADEIINQLIHYFETIRGQTERNASPDYPLTYN